ncbi:MAG: alanine--tRNA ligase [Proteobacteria bacterium]|nr:alanine--tRNA ligase [Pseudomonadota bacterium]
MKSDDIRKSFLDYFASKGHRVIGSSALLPQADPTLLFTNAGMNQFKPVFLAEETRDYSTAATSQKCMRAGGKHNDLENVGRTARHHTFFEMLGNFSFGDYFKETAIEYAWDFLVNRMGLDAEKLYATVYTDDDEAAGIWADKIGLPPERILRLGEKDNFWSMGDVGPCGPCSEILIDQGEALGCDSPTCAPGCDCDRYLEIWNLVFMQFDRDAEGTLAPLPAPCIDTGMGLERLSAVMQGKLNNYDTDLFTPIIEKIEEISGVKYGADSETDFSIRAVADHARAIAFSITDGILPSNVDRGYVLRRIIRRAARHGRLLGIREPFLYKVTAAVSVRMGGVYPELTEANDFVARATMNEEKRFLETLERGLTLLETEVDRLKQDNLTVLSGTVAFRLYDTFGFPVDLTADIIERDGFTVDDEGFETEMEVQRSGARAAREKAMAALGAGSDESALYGAMADGGIESAFVGYHMEAVAGKVLAIIANSKEVESATKSSKSETVQVVTDQTPFYGESGGQTGDTGSIVADGLSIEVIDTKRPVPSITVHYCKVKEGTLSVGDTVELIPDIERRRAIRRSHTATHLLQSALRDLIGEHVKQAGSLVTPGHLRFDFNHFEATDAVLLKKIEEFANQAVLDNIEVTTDVLSYDDAIKRGALAFFGEKYSSEVRMVSVAGVSTELCGGTHVNRTGDIGLIKITAESSIAAGIRRIEAVTGHAALKSVEEAETALKESARLLRVPAAEVPVKVAKLMERTKEIERELQELKGKSKANEAGELADEAKEINGITVFAKKIEADDPKKLRQMADTLRTKLGSGVILLGSAKAGKAFLLAAVTKDLTDKLRAGDIIKRIAPIVGGRGGGKPELAQAGGTEPDKLDAAIAELVTIVEELG